MEELDIKQLLQILLKRWWIIVSSTLVFSIVAAIISFFVLTPVYESDAKVYVGKNVEASDAINYNEILLNDRLVNDYRELMKSRMVTGMVIEQLGLKDLTEAQIANKIGVSSVKDTRFIKITVSDTDPAMAKKIANKVAEVFKDNVVTVMNIENVQIIDSAELPINPVKPNKKMNVAIAFVLGAMLGAGVVFLLEYFDNTLKTPDDVQRNLDLPVIGTIPVFPE